MDEASCRSTSRASLTWICFSRLTYILWSFAGVFWILFFAEVAKSAYTLTLVSSELRSSKAFLFVSRTMSIQIWISTSIIISSVFSCSTYRSARISRIAAYFYGTVIRWTGTPLYIRVSCWEGASSGKLWYRFAGICNLGDWWTTSLKTGMLYSEGLWRGIFL